MKVFFPVFYDIKYLMKYCGLYGGLNKVTETLTLNRVGTSHQAGFDSLLIGRAFIKIKEIFFDNGSPRQYAGVLHGLGNGN